MLGAVTTRVPPRVVDGISVSADIGARKPAKPRRLAIWANLSARLRFLGHDNSFENLHRAIDERIFHVKGEGGVLVKTPQAAPGAWTEFRSYETFFARELAGSRRLTCAEFLAQCSRGKRKLYARAIEEFEVSGCSPRHAWLTPFVKFEKLNFSSKPDPAPRVIQPRTAVYNVALGRYVRAVAGKMCHTIDKLFNDHPVVVKGFTPSEVGEIIHQKMMARPGVVCVLLDASRFDQHVGVDALKFEHRCWKAPFGPDKELDWLLKQQLNNTAVARVDGKVIKYKTRGTRASGDMNTGEGNCILMCCMIHKFCTDLKLGWFDLVNNGDDCGLFIEEQYLPIVMSTYRSWFLKLGFEMELEATDMCPSGVARITEHIRFCQASPVRTPSGYVMVREPFTGLSKDSIALGIVTDLEHRQWLMATGLCGMSLFADIPLYRASYTKMIANGVESNIKYSNGMSGQGLMRAGRRPRFDRWDNVNISDVTRVSFAIAFGIPPSIQLRVEREIDAASLGVLEDKTSWSWFSPAERVGALPPL